MLFESIILCKIRQKMKIFPYYNLIFILFGLTFILKILRLYNLESIIFCCIHLFYNTEIRLFRLVQNIAFISVAWRFSDSKDIVH